jgi:hypothetical protein
VKRRASRAPRAQPGVNGVVGLIPGTYGEPGWAGCQLTGSVDTASATTSPPDDPDGSAAAVCQLPPARCQEYDEPNTAIAFPDPSIAADTGTAGVVRAVTIVSPQAPDADRVSNPVRRAEHEPHGRDDHDQ